MLPARVKDVAVKIQISEELSVRQGQSQGHPLGVKKGRREQLSLPSSFVNNLRSTNLQMKLRRLSLAEEIWKTIQVSDGRKPLPESAS